MLALLCIRNLSLTKTALFECFGLHIMSNVGFPLKSFLFVISFVDIYRCFLFFEHTVLKTYKQIIDICYICLNCSRTDKWWSVASWGTSLSLSLCLCLCLFLCLCLSLLANESLSKVSFWWKGNKVPSFSYIGAVLRIHATISFLLHRIFHVRSSFPIVGVRFWHLFWWEMSSVASFWSKLWRGSGGLLYNWEIKK